MVSLNHKGNKIVLLNSSLIPLPRQGSVPQAALPVFRRQMSRRWGERWARPTGPRVPLPPGGGQKGRKILEGSITSLLLDPVLFALLLLFHPKSYHMLLWPTARGKLVLGRSPGPGVWCLGPGPAPALPRGSGASLLPLSLISLLENPEVMFS